MPTTESNSFVAEMERLRKEVDALERFKGEAGTQRRLAEQRAADAESKLAEVVEERNTARRQRDEFSSIAARTVAVEEKLASADARISEERTLREYTESRLAQAEASLETTRAERNDVSAANGELTRKIERADRIAAAWLKRAEADAALDEATAA